MDARAKRLEYLAQQIKNQRMIARRQQFPMIPPSQKVDIRSEQQIMEGYEARRVALREKLRTITSDVIASQLSRDLTDDQVFYSLNNWPRISKYLKERFALGVPAQVYFYHLRDLAKEMKV
jgi:hypothetical protein